MKLDAFGRTIPPLSSYSPPCADEIRLGIALPHVSDSVDFAFFVSFIELETPGTWTLLLPDIPSGDFADHIAAIRQVLAERARAERCTHLWFIDTDEAFPRDTLQRLLARRLPIVTAPVHRRYPPFDHLLKRRIGDRYEQIADSEAYSGSLIQIDATGCGCMLIETSVFDRIPIPWFEMPKKEGDPGEDIGFCEKARAAGIAIHADTAIQIDHIARTAINRRFRQIYLMRDKIIEGGQQ
jgi:hypothetical protein